MKGEKDKIKELEKQKQELESALAQAHLRKNNQTNDFRALIFCERTALICQKKTSGQSTSC